MATSTNGRLQGIGLLLFGGCSTGALAGNAYQWTDRHGQLHFGDRPPGRTESTEIRLPRQRASTASGLRPGELATLRTIEQRADRQQRRAREERRHSQQRQASEQAACRTQREKLRQARGKDGFKPHARYLRTHCW